MKTAWSVLGGIGISAFVLLVVLFYRYPMVREVGGMLIGGIIFLILWLFLALKLCSKPRFDEEFVMGIVLLVLWTAFVVLLCGRPDFALLMAPVATAMGIVTDLALIGYGSFKAIKK